jgi:hypothetical protein
MILVLKIEKMEQCGMFVHLFFLITRDALRFPNFERPDRINIFKAQNQTNLIFNFKRPKSNLPQISCSLFENLETKFELFKKMKKKIKLIPKLGTTNEIYPSINVTKWFRHSKPNGDSN